jgi:DNA-binding MarR family transcriptional regulator
MEEMRIYGSIFNQFSRLFGSWLGLHSTDSEALMEIVHAEERHAPLSPARLGSRIGLTSGATTSMLNRLEQAGHITRSRESTDRRVVTLRSSPNVHARADEFFASLAEQLDTAMSRYSTEQLDNFEDLLVDLRTTMDNHLTERIDGRCPDPRQTRQSPIKPRLDEAEPADSTFAGVSGDLRSGGLRLRRRWFGCDVDGSFEQLGLVEDGAGTDEGNQLGGIDLAPACLGGFDELVGHRQPGRA